MASTSSSSAKRRYEVFINQRAVDVEDSLGNKIRHELNRRGLRSFSDGENLEAGKMVSDAAKEAISDASVHIALFTPKYPESPRCLEELTMMLKTGKPTIPVFDHVEPSDLRWVSERGVYYEAFSQHEKDGRYSLQQLEEWKRALSKASELSGYIFNDRENDQGHLVEKVVNNVMDVIHAKHPVFINHRGLDVKKSLASNIYHALKLTRVGSFLDKKELIAGEKFADQIFKSISEAFVHIVIFSPNYAQSSWCLKELTLMLQTGKRIIPIFYNVKRSDIRLVAEGKGVYSEAFSKHEKQDRYPPRQLEEWKMALFKASDIPGYEINQRENNEGTVVKKIVKDVMEELRSAIGRYPAFINHRGIGVENPLVGIMYDAIDIKLAQQFLDIERLESRYSDREQLEAGEEIADAAKEAISDALVHIVILSPDYAQSARCLDELTLMLQTDKQIILIFDHVEPSDLRLVTQGTGVYSEAFSKHEKDGRYPPQKLEEWKMALSNLSVSDNKVNKCENEQELLIEKIVNDVMEKIKNIKLRSRL